jgi:hypothetical protein
VKHQLEASARSIGRRFSHHPFVMGRDKAVSHKHAPREGAVQVSLSDMARLEFSDIGIYSSYIREQVELLEQYVQRM